MNKANGDARVHLSKSILTTWERCRLAYRYQRIDRLEDTEPPSVAQHRGTVGHAAVAEILKTGLDAESKEGREVLARVFRTHSVAEADEQQLREWVISATKFAYDIGGRLEWIEQLIGVDRNPGFVLWGKTDVVALGGELAPVEVIDWTFGKPRFKNPDEFQNSLGAKIYRLCLGHAIPDRQLRPIVVTEVHVPSGSKMIAFLSDEDVSAAWQQMKSYAAEIRAARAAGEFSPTPGTHCKWCEYRDRCPVALNASEATPL